MVRLVIVLAFAACSSSPPVTAPPPSTPTEPSPTPTERTPTEPPPTKPAPKPAGLVDDGASCLAVTDCQSSVCEGEGCGANQPGTCAPSNRGCTRDLRSYCGCDGQTFRASGSCPKQRFSARAACP